MTRNATPAMPPSPPDPYARNAAGLMLAVVLFALCVVWRFSGVIEKEGVDFYHFWAVPKGVALGYPKDVYTPEGRERLGRLILEIAERTPGQPRFQAAARTRAVWDKTGSPGLYAVMAIWSLGSYDTCLLIFRLAAMACGIGAIFLIGRRHLRYSYLTLLILAALLIYFNEPVRADLEVGNINFFQLLLLGVLIHLAAARGTAGRRSAAWFTAMQGFLLGAALVVKLNLYGVFILLFLYHTAMRDWAALGRWLAGAAAGALAVAVWAGVYFGDLGIWLDWRATVSELIGEGFPTRSGNFSIIKALDERTGWNLTVPMNVALFGAAAGVVWSTGRRLGGGAGERGRFEIETLCIAAGAAIPLLTSQIAWWHYYILAIPLILMAFRPLGEGRRPGRLRQGAALAGLLLYCSWPVDPGYLVSKGLLELWILRMALSVVLFLAVATGDVLALGRDQNADISDVGMMDSTQM